MANQYSSDDLLEFLDHAAERGLMPAATAQALAVASRNVFGILSDEERSDLGQLDVPAVVKRFNNKRAKDFSPSSLKEYGRRVTRAIDLFLKWREDPANFTVKTRATGRRKERVQDSAESPQLNLESDQPEGHMSVQRGGAYQSAVPVRPGLVVSIANIPHDLTKAEAERLANFVRMLAIGD